VDTWVLVWLLISMVGTVAVIAVLISLIRHVLLVGRTARELSDAVRPMLDEIKQQGERASERSSRTRAPTFRARSRGG
jgi:hypothetical protein